MHEIPVGIYPDKIDFNLVKKATDRSTIEREIAEGRAREGSVFGFLNNFETRLPGGHWFASRGKKSSNTP